VDWVKWVKWVDWVDWVDWVGRPLRIGRTFSCKRKLYTKSLADDCFCEYRFIVIMQGIRDGAKSLRPPLKWSCLHFKQRWSTFPNSVIINVMNEYSQIHFRRPDSWIQIFHMSKLRFNPTCFNPTS